MDDLLFQSRYLNLLQTESTTPDLDCLRGLVKLHLHRIPFENISKFHYYLHQGQTGEQWLPTMDTYLTNITNKGLGGNCYILNAHFGRLLQSLGFKVDIIRATGGNTHLALKVTVNNKAYYVDVGYGAPLFEPLSLEELPCFSRCGEEVEITKLGNYQYRIDRRTNGQSFVTKCIEWNPVSLESFDEVITHSLRDEEDNPFMRRIVATVFKQNIGYSVINHKLFIKTDQSTVVHDYTRKPDWMEIMRMTFGFEADVLEEALEFLKVRGVHLFANT
ncbi:MULTISPECIES: arylamine N-acetyltransferase [unclassified Paenibacillus]|uniref:arylamine N-acetyltransferase n=1 Tax=unclassified Paenibacillus TaxID=185978 RepID=UPI003644B8FE